MSRDLDPALLEQAAQALTGNGSGDGMVWTLDEAEPIARAVLAAIADDLARPAVDAEELAEALAEVVVPGGDDCFTHDEAVTDQDDYRRMARELLASGVAQDAATVAARARREALTDAADTLAHRLTPGHPETCRCTGCRARRIVTSLGANDA